MKQVEKVMADKSRLLQRTQLKRTEFSVLGKAAVPAAEAALAEEPADMDDWAVQGKAKRPSEAKVFDTEIFDDGDFYHEVLRDLIERKAAAADASDPLAMGRHWVELSKLRKKVKRTVDTKASKGAFRFSLHGSTVGQQALRDQLPHHAAPQGASVLYA